jgi:hypothetical protein
MQFLTDFADQAVILPLTFASALGISLGGWKRGAVAWLLAIFATLGVVAVAKLVVFMLGPPGRLPLLLSPSGHAASASLLYGGLAYALLPGRKWRVAGAVLGAAAGLAVAWVVAFDGLRGQALMAAVLGSIAAGAVSVLVVRSLSDEEGSAATPYAAAVVAAVAGPLVGLVAPGPAELSSAIVGGSLPGVLMVQPLDWAAGLLLGVPIGVGWIGALAGPARESKAGAARSHV